MGQSVLRLVKTWTDRAAMERMFDLEGGLRGIYVLYRHIPRSGAYDVVYVGMATRGGIRARLKLHRRRKRNLWTHFSLFEVWDNIGKDEITELEGLFRQIYSRDRRANALNKQRSFKKLRQVPRTLK